MKRSRTLSLLASVGLGLLACLTTGCQVDVGGQTLPSAFYYLDDVHYAPAGPEFKLSQEAALLKAQAVEAASQQQ